jgi:hypothetical protein
MSSCNSSPVRARRARPEKIRLSKAVSGDLFADGLSLSNVGISFKQ